MEKKVYHKVHKKAHKNLRSCLIMSILLCILMFTVSAQAAEKKTVKVKVNNSYTGELVKTDGVWTLDASRSPQEKPFKDMILYLRVPAGNELKSGYYAFTSKGRLDNRKVFHKLDTRIGETRFKGTYYFGEENGRLRVNKGGWNTISGKKYYLSNTGRRYENRWVKGYYMLSNGRIAVSMKTPDGFYVDCDGRKCEKSEMRLSGLKKTLNTMIGGYSGSWSVYVKDLKTGDVLSINDKAMRPASVIKLFTMVSVYDRIDKGLMKKDDTVNRLLKDMITVSDNESFNSLVRKHSKNGNFLDGCKILNAYLKKAGCRYTEAHRTLHPSSSAYIDGGKGNYSSAKDAGMILEKIYKGQCVSKSASKEMLNLLLKQTRRWKIPAGLPSGTKCANKTGENSTCQNDVAIVYGEKTNYVVCIFAETGEYSGVNGIKNLSAKIYDYLN